MGKLAVVAIGGNSLIKDKQHQRVEDQYKAVCETAEHIVDIIEQGYEVIVSHGNGPQVGFILRRGEIAFKVEGLHLVSLTSCVADTQGAIGYQIQQAINNEFLQRGIEKQTVAVVTQVEVDINDTAFSNPSKPIGNFYNEEEAQTMQAEYPEWKMINDSGRGYRRVVPSPKPVKIIEQEAIQRLAADNFCVVAVGGGGIPVVRKEGGKLEGIDAVIDKDFASSLLAAEIGADTLIISTGVEKVCLNFGKPDQKEIQKMTLSEAKKYLQEGHFAAGSMMPKIKAVISFLENGGKRAIITNPESLGRAIRGETGTHIS